jgi:tagatose kinase
MGGSAAIVACVGDDDFGKINTQRLSRDGADISAISVSPDYPTGSAFVRYRVDGSRDFVYNIAKSAASFVTLTNEARTLFERSGHLHVMGTALSIPNVWQMLRYAIGVMRGRGGTISVDPNLRKELLAHGQTRERFAHLIEVADLVLPSGDELAVATGHEDEQSALSALFNRGASEVVVKRGEAGAALFTADGARVDSPGFVVEEVDPTGAGDCFGGAYVACRRLGMSARMALDYAKPRARGTWLGRVRWRERARARNLTLSSRPLRGGPSRDRGLNDSISRNRIDAS